MKNTNSLVILTTVCLLITSFSFNILYGQNSFEIAESDSLILGEWVT